MMANKGFKTTELGVIPKEWEVSSLGVIGDVKMCRRVFNSDTRKTGAIPFYKIGTFGKEPDAYISEELYSNYRKRFSFPKKGEILISASGTLGRTVVYDGKPSYFQDSNIVWIANNEKFVSNKFLFYVLQVVQYGSEGSTIQRLYNNIIKKTKFILPPLPEQKAIAEVLSDTDKLIQALEKQIAKKSLIKQGMMQELLRPKEGWEKVRLGDFIKFQTGFPFSSEYFTTDPVGIRLVKNRDLRSDDTIVYYFGSYSNEFVVNDGDLLIGMDGDFEPILWRKGKALLNQRVGRIIRQKNISLSCLSYILSNELKNIESRTSSTTVKHLSHSEVEKIEIQIPKVEVQNKIAEILLDIEAEIDVITLKSSKVKSLKKGLMQNLLTGKIRLNQ